MKLKRFVIGAILSAISSVAYGQGQLPANTVWGNPTGSKALPIAMSKTQLTTLCNTFTATLPGCVPLSGGGVNNFLRADGSWAAPAAAASISIGVSTIVGGTTNQLLYDNGGVFGEITKGNNCVYLTNGSGVPSCGTALPTGTTLPAGLFANPTSSVGLATVNGVLTTVMRSDAAPALDQTISPTWTGQHTWNVVRTITSGTNATLDDVLIQSAITTIVGNAGSPITALSKVRLQAPTYTDASAVTVTDAATLTITGAPIAAGSVTITNPWSFLVLAGNVKLAGTGNSVGTITAGTWNGGLIPLAFGGTNANLTASAGGIVYSTGSAMAILAGTATPSLCLLSANLAPPTWGACAGGGAVASVGNAGADSTVTIAGTGSGPWTGTVTVKINLANANTWTAAQDQTLSTNAGFNSTITNSNGGTGTYAAWKASNGTNTLQAGVAGTAYTAIPLLTAKAFLVSSTDMVLDTAAASPIVFGINNAESARFSTTAGELDLGVNTTTAGQLKMYGGTSGNLILKTAAVAGSAVISMTSSGTSTMTFPAVTDTVAVLGTEDQLLAGGANVTSKSLSAGNITVDAGARPLQYIPNTGAFTVTAPANDGSFLLQIENGVGAGAVGFSGFTVSANTGDATTTTNGNKFVVSIWRIHGVSSYFIKAIQ